jgi:hypothetical protein
LTFSGLHRHRGREDHQQNQLLSDAVESVLVACRDENHIAAYDLTIFGGRFAAVTFIRAAPLKT